LTDDIRDDTPEQEQEQTQYEYNSRLPFLRDKANRLPLASGVYLMKDKSGKVIYVGKAKQLKNRVSSYFRGVESHAFKTYKLVEKIHDFDFIVTPSELDALVLESSQIKQRSPKYNILLKDAKGANYIKISGGEFPRLSYALQKDDPTAVYLGPYAEGFTIRRTVEDANGIFRLPTCSRVFPRDFGKERPCLNLHIKKCMGVCTGRISADEYKSSVDSALRYIKGGSKESIERLTLQMNTAAERLEFEKAAKYRDQIAAITRAEHSQSVMTERTYAFDLLAVSQNAGLSAVTVIKYRDGKLIDKENFFLGDEYPPEETRYDFILNYYAKDETPKELLLDGEVNDRELLEEYLTGKRGGKVTVAIPKRGEGLTLVTLAKSNAAEYLALRVGRTSSEVSALEELSKTLGLSKTPQRIECYDISNMGNESIVAAMTVWKNGRAFKQGYRKFHIKTTQGANDTGSMAETLERRLTSLKEEREGWNERPDLILLDGGKGQVSAVKEVAERLGFADIPLFGLTKDDKHRTRAVTSDDGEIRINENRRVFKFLTEMQDETHRFAIGFMKQSHAKQAHSSILEKADGIGKKRAENLLKTFKTKAALKSATVEELKAATKLSDEKAENLKKYIEENL
jgi:excinuclease ABC subunit C